MRELLEAEGVTFEDNRVRLDKHLWIPPNPQMVQKADDFVLTFAVQNHGPRSSICPKRHHLIGHQTELTSGGDGIVDCQLSIEDIRESDAIGWDVPGVGSCLYEGDIVVGKLSVRMDWAGSRCNRAKHSSFDGKDWHFIGFNQAQGWRKLL